MTSVRPQWIWEVSIEPALIDDSDESQSAQHFWQYHSPVRVMASSPLSAIRWALAAAAVQRPSSVDYDLAAVTIIRGLRVHASEGLDGQGSVLL